MVKEFTLGHAWPRQAKVNGLPAWAVEQISAIFFKPTLFACQIFFAILSAVSMGRGIILGLILGRCRTGSTLENWLAKPIVPG